MPKRWIPGEIITASGLNQTTPFGVVQQPVPNLTVNVAPGSVILGGQVVTFSGGNSPQFSVPSSNPRIDLLVVTESGTLEIVQGTESDNPTAPDYPADKFVICEVYNRPSQTCIKDSDDNTNGYIYKDVGAFMANFSFVRTFTAGEYIVRGDPIHIDSDGKVYVCDTGNVNRINFAGFALSNAVRNSEVPVVLVGKVDIFSGLIMGFNYYVQDRTWQVDQAQTATSDSTSATNVWQSFTPSASSLYGVGFYLRNAALNFITADITIRIYAGEGTSGTLLSTVTSTISISSGVTAFFNFTLDSPISLTPGQKYTIAVNSSDSNIYWYYKTDNPYPGGISSINPNYDFTFRTYSLIKSNIGLSPGSRTVKAGRAISSTGIIIAI
jgi:hypothetical protein